MQVLHLIGFFIAFLFPIMVGFIFGDIIIEFLYNRRKRVDVGLPITLIILLPSIILLYWLNYFIISKLFDVFNINVIVYIWTPEYSHHISLIYIISILFASVIANVLAQFVELKDKSIDKSGKQRIRELENEK